MKECLAGHRRFTNTRDPQALMVNWVSETLHCFLSKGLIFAYQPNIESTIADESCIITVYWYMSSKLHRSVTLLPYPGGHEIENFGKPSLQNSVWSSPRSEEDDF